MILADQSIQRALLDRTHKQTYHEQDGKVVVNTYQDVEPHLEYAAKCRRADAEGRGAFGKRKDWHRTMSPPFNILLGIAQKLGIPAGEIFDSQHSKRIWKELKSPEYKAFRVTIDKRI